MPNPDKVAKVEALAALLEKSQAVYLADFSGLTVSEMNDLRRRFRAEGVTLTVAKNTLMRIAADKAGVPIAAPHLRGMRATAFSADPSAPARVIHEFAKDHDGKPAVVGVFYDRNELDSAKVEMLATLPSREVLLSRLLLTWQGPLRNLVGVWSALMRKFVGTLDAVREKRGEA